MEIDASVYEPLPGKCGHRFFFHLFLVRKEAYILEGLNRSKEKFVLGLVGRHGSHEKIWVVTDFP